MTDPVLHVDLVLLREEATESTTRHLYDEAAALRDLAGVSCVGVIEGDESGDFGLAFFFVLHSQTQLEGFGTDPRYIRFLQGGLAGALRSFAGADVQLQGAWPEAEPYAACLGVMAPPQTYDWQVREAIFAWCGPHGVAGLAVGDRQRYRGIGMRFSEQPLERPRSGFEGFGVEFVGGRCRVLL